MVLVPEQHLSSEVALCIQDTLRYLPAAPKRLFERADDKNQIKTDFEYEKLTIDF